MKQKVILTIDSTSRDETKVTIRAGNHEKSFSEQSGSVKSQTLLPLIEKALTELNFKRTDISEIKVNPGPGSFTGTRVGISIANALGWVLGVPVNGKKLELPQYAESKFDS